MKDQHVGLVNKSERNHRVLKPNQTGFSSPATHYTEPRIDLNEVLIDNVNSTFFVRVKDDAFKTYDIRVNDVLIIDKALTPKNNQLVFVIYDGEFEILRYNTLNGKEYKLWGTITYIIKSVK